MKLFLMIRKARMTLEQAPENIPKGQACEVNIIVATPQAVSNGM